MGDRIWSEQQQAVFRDVAEGEGHTVVLARAGSGKTTTIVQAFNFVPAGQSVLMVAFNKSIATELQARAPKGVEVSTLHSFGLKTIYRTLGKVRVDDRKTDGLILQVVGPVPDFGPDPTPEEKSIREYEIQLRASYRKCVGLAKGMLAETTEDVEAIVDLHGIMPPDSEADRPAFMANVLTMLARAREMTSVVDFDDMIWLPVVLGLRVRQFDRVFIDETQDLNSAQIELALRACKKGGRICAVGDDRQAIYTFRGAYHDAVDNVIRRLDAKVLPLSITYRCGSAIVDVARRFVPDFSAADNAPRGEVTKTDFSKMREHAGPGDFILSRVNAPLVGLCMGFLKAGRRATIQGRDIGSRLSGIVKRSRAKSVESLVEYVCQWRDLECARLAKKDRDTSSVEDTAECLLSLCEGATELEIVQKRIADLFSDDDDMGRIVLSSTHKAKGLERERVWMLESTYMRKPRKGEKRTPAQEREEENLYYVAVTRAKLDLRLVQGQPKGRE
jgi:ATP-dependent DNA helicase UvrD/PcrA